VAASPINAKSLERIESAMIVVCLDDTRPVTREDASWQTWVGDGRNRFYDKHQRTQLTLVIHSYSFKLLRTVIVYENGKSGFLGEHSCMDGKYRFSNDQSIWH
jgi:carnitine O-acetyltransferase